MCSSDLPEVTAIELAADGLLQQRYDARPGTVYLIRPDRYVAARWRHPTAEAVGRALDRAIARGA